MSRELSTEVAKFLTKLRRDEGDEMQVAGSAGGASQPGKAEAFAPGYEGVAEGMSCFRWCTSVTGIDVDSAGSRVQGADDTNCVDRPIAGVGASLVNRGDGGVVGGDVDVRRAEERVVEFG
ncbi:hypothetical protein [Amycolatopsis sp. lyj-108]|uniref:hypothetical protein n=1 Tax=Amycolatopsis sp. lyj-108 TaxID=2789286 RepID=UPI00397AB728